MLRELPPRPAWPASATLLLMSYLAHTPATIAVGETTSGAIDLEMHDLVGLVLPAEFEGTAVTFEAAATSDGTFLPVHDKTGAEVSLTVAAGRLVTLDRDLTSGARFIKIVSGTAQTTTDTAVIAVLDTGR